MRRPLLISGALAALGAVPLAIVLVVLPGNAERAIDLYVVYLGALLLLALVRITAGARERRPADWGREREESAPAIAELARIEREVVLSTARDFDLHIRMRPILRDIAEHRLWTQRGIDLDREPDRAREVLGAEAWDILKRDRPEPRERFVRGLDLAGLIRVVDRIEAV